MNICFVSREYPPETGFGGIGSYVFDLSQELSKNGHEVHVISFSLEGSRSYDEGHVHVHRIKKSELGALWRIDRYLPLSNIVRSYVVAKRIREIEREKPFDIIEFAEYGAEGFWYALRTRRIPYIVKLHTPFLLHDKYNSSKPHFRSKVVHLMEKFMVKRASGISSPSRALHQYAVEDYKIYDKRISVIPNSIDTRLFTPSADVFPENHRRRKVLYVGRYEKIKGTHVLCEAIPIILKSLPDTHFTFIGADTNTDINGGSHRNYLLRRMSEMNVQRNVTMLDRINRPELVKYYQECSLVVAPSLFENFPMTCLEAMACGKAIVSTKVGGITEMIIDGVTGVLVDADNAEELAQVIINLLKNDYIREVLGKKARDRVQALFSGRIIADKTVSFYKQVIAGTR